MFLANENFPFPSIALLREQGYMVESIGKTYHGISDEEVLQIAFDKNLIILTFDSDYGELIFKYKKEAPPAVVYFRYKGSNATDVANLLLEILKKDEIQLFGKFTVIEHDAIRQRVLIVRK